MSSEDGQHGSGKTELFWAIPKGTVYFEPAVVVSLTAAEYERCVKAEQHAQDTAQRIPKPLEPATLAEMIQRKGAL